LDKIDNVWAKNALALTKESMQWQM